MSKTFREEYDRLFHVAMGRCSFFGIDIALTAISTAIAWAAAQAAAGAAAIGLGTAATTVGGVGMGGATVAVPGSGLAGVLGSVGSMASAVAGSTTTSSIMTGTLSTMEVVSLAAEGVGTVASAATSVYSGYAQARQETAMAKAQSRMAEYNASVMDTQAEAETMAGRATLRDARIRGEQIRDRHRYVKGAQQAALAKSGVVSSSGTPLLVASEEAMTGKLNVMDEIWKGKMAKREFDIRAGNFAAQAEGMRMEGQFAKTLGKQRAKSAILSGYIGAGSALLGGIASEYDMYNKYKGNGKMLSDQFGAGGGKSSSARRSYDQYGGKASELRRSNYYSGVA